MELTEAERLELLSGPKQAGESERDRITRVATAIAASRSADMEAQRDAASMRSGEWARRNWNASADMKARIRDAWEQAHAEFCPRGGPVLDVCSTHLRPGDRHLLAKPALLDAAPAGGAEAVSGGYDFAQVRREAHERYERELDAPSEVPHD